MATLVAELHEVIRANTPDEREYKRYMDGIKNSDVYKRQPHAR